MKKTMIMMVMVVVLLQLLALVVAGVQGVRVDRGGGGLLLLIAGRALVASLGLQARLVIILLLVELTS